MARSRRGSGPAARISCETRWVTLAILDVIGDPALAFRSIGTAEQPLLAQVFSGQCRIGDQPDQKLLAKLSGGGRSPLRLGFYAPGAGPFVPSYLLSAWAEVTLSKTEVSTSDFSQAGPYGVDAAAVQLVDDGKGSGMQWPYLSFTAYGGEPMVIRYRLTVTQPAN
jgi:hypothetical protein